MTRKPYAELFAFLFLQKKKGGKGVSSVPSPYFPIFEVHKSRNLPFTRLHCDTLKIYYISFKDFKNRTSSF